MHIVEITLEGSVSQNFDIMLTGSFLFYGM